jgi:hypothetical protein
MPTKLVNGTYRVQIRIAGHPAIDRTFSSLAAAEKFEEVERERLKSGELPLSPKTLLRDAVEAYQRSSMFRAKKLNTQKTERSRIRRAVDALGEYSLENLAVAPLGTCLRLISDGRARGLYWRLRT